MGTFWSSQSEAFLSELMMFHELLVIREVKHDVYGKRQKYGKSINTYVFQLVSFFWEVTRYFWLTDTKGA